MQICRRLAGYSYAGADIVRRAMAKKDKSKMQAEREAFLLGCEKNGINLTFANEIFDEMVGFAEYAFNKSHATVYGVQAYRTAYLKVHYPAEYFTALMSSVLGSSGDIKKYIADAARYRVKVLPPSINESRDDFSVKDGNIRFGLMAIKNVGRQFATAVIAEREKAKFKSFDDFVSRMAGGDLNKRTVESLIKCGVFDELGTPRSALLATYESIIESQQEKTRSNISGQLDMFSMLSGVDAAPRGYTYPDIKEFPLKDLLLLEKESSGMYFSGHMIDSYSDNLAGLACDGLSDIIDDLDEELKNPNPKYKDKMTVNLGVIISAKKTKVTRSGETMAFLTVEDRTAEIEVIVFAKSYSKIKELLNVDSAVYLTGHISKEDGEAPRIILATVKELLPNGEYVKSDSKPDAKADSENKKARLFIKISGDNDPRINVIYRTAQFNRGDTEIVVYNEATKKYSVMTNIKTVSSEKVLAKLREVFGEQNVILK